MHSKVIPVPFNSRQIDLASSVRSCFALVIAHRGHPEMSKHADLFWGGKTADRTVDMIVGSPRKVDDEPGSFSKAEDSLHFRSQI